MNKSHQASHGDPNNIDERRDGFQPPGQKINGAASQAYFQHDYPQQNYRVYVGPSNAPPPPTPPKVPQSAPPPPPPPKPPRTSNVPNLETVVPQYSVYGMSDEHLYMNGGPAAGMLIGQNLPECSPVFSNRTTDQTNASPYHQQSGMRAGRQQSAHYVASPRHDKFNGNRIPMLRGQQPQQQQHAPAQQQQQQLHTPAQQQQQLPAQSSSSSSKDDFHHLLLHKNKAISTSQQQQQQHQHPSSLENIQTNNDSESLQVHRNDAATLRRQQKPDPDNLENGCRRRTSQGGGSEVPLKVSNNSVPYSYGTYRASQYPQQEKLLNYHPLFHSPVINSKQQVPVERYSNYYYGSSRLADMSQGSCDNTPATPDSLDSLVGSDDLCQSPQSICSELPPPPPTELDWRSSNGNLSTSQLSQRDNLIEEIMTPVPTEDVTSSLDVTPLPDKKSLNVTSLENSKVSPSCSSTQSSSSSTSSTESSSSTSSSASIHSSVKGATSGAFQTSQQEDVSSLSSPSNITSTLVGASSSTTPIVRTATNSSNSAQSLTSINLQADVGIWKTPPETENKRSSNAPHYYPIPNNNNDPWAVGQKLYQQQLQQLQPQQLMQHQLQYQQQQQQQQQLLQQQQQQQHLIQQQQQQQLLHQQQQQLRQKQLQNQKQQQQQLQQLHQQKLQQQQQQLQQQQLQQQQLQQQQYQQQQYQQQQQLQQQQLHQQQLHQQQLQQQQLLQQQQRQWPNGNINDISGECAIYQPLVPLNNSNKNNSTTIYDNTRPGVSNGSNAFDPNRQASAQGTPRMKQKILPELPNDTYASIPRFTSQESTSFSSYSTLQRRADSGDKNCPTLIRSNSGSQVLRTSHPQIRQMTQEEILSQQQQQMIVNRYATVGRNASHGHHQNYNNTYYGIPQYYPPQQQQQTIQAQVLQQDEPAGQKQRRPHRQHSGSNDSLAARINSNLTSDQLVSMRLAESKSSCTDLKDALPLTDVRGMAKRAQPRPPPATPPFQQNRHAPFNNQMARPLSGPIASRLPESRSCDEILSADTDDDHSGASSGAEAGESDDGTSAKEERPKMSTKNGVKTRRRRMVRKTSVPELLSPPKPRKPPFTIESAMSSIFKKKKTKNEIEEVVVEKVILNEESLLQQQQQQPTIEAKQQNVEVNSDKKADTKAVVSSGQKGLKSRFLFSISRSKREETDSDKKGQQSVEPQVTTPMLLQRVDSNRSSDSQINEIAKHNLVQSNHIEQGSNGHAKSNENNIGQCDNDILCAKPIQSKKRWSRHTKASPPPPPPQQTKTNGILLKAPAPPPPVPSAPVPNPISSSPEPPPLAPKGIRPVVPASSSMTSLRSSGPQQPNGLTPNGRASQPVTPATEKRSDLVTKLRQGDEGDAGRDGKLLLLRSGLEAGVDDVNLNDVRNEDEAGLHEDKSKRKNPQVSSISGNGGSNSPLISKEPSPRSGADSEDNDGENDETEDEGGAGAGGGDGVTPENEMEYCDPCVCYGKCCLDVVASIFCVSLL